MAARYRSGYPVPGGVERSLTQKWGLGDRKRLHLEIASTSRNLFVRRTSLAAGRHSKAEIVQHDAARLFFAASASGVFDPLWFGTRNLHRPIDLAALASGAGDADAGRLMHQQVAAVSIRCDPLVQSLRESGVADGKVFGGSFGIEVRHPVAEWPEDGMIHRISCGHRFGLLLRDSVESRIDRHRAFAVLMAKAGNQLGGRCGPCGGGAGEGDHDRDDSRKPRRN